jgi:hypothetical protein
MKSEIQNSEPAPHSQSLRGEGGCPCPLDHLIVEAVIAWAEATEVCREEAWSRLVDLLNCKTAAPSCLLDPESAIQNQKPAPRNSLSEVGSEIPSNAPGEAIPSPRAVISRANGGSCVCGGSRRVPEGLDG